MGALNSVNMASRGKIFSISITKVWGDGEGVAVKRVLQLGN